MWYIIWALFMAYGIYLFVLVWMRQSAAKELLSDTKTPISQVASEVGYDNYSYFTKIFKEKTGVSPGDYRKQQAE